MDQPSEIVVLEGLEAVRRRPESYVGDLSFGDLPSRLVVQAFCHAFDEAIDGKCTHLSLSCVDREIVSVVYDAGIDLTPHPGKTSAAEMMLTSLGACSNLKKHIDIGSKYCSEGLAVLNALSAGFTAEIRHGGLSRTLSFSRGEPTDHSPLTQTSEADVTRFEFRLDPVLLNGNTMPEYSKLAAWTQEWRLDIPGLLIEIEPW